MYKFVKTSIDIIVFKFGKLLQTKCNTLILINASLCGNKVKAIGEVHYNKCDEPQHSSSFFLF